MTGETPAGGGKMCPNVSWSIQVHIYLTSESLKAKKNSYVTRKLQFSWERRDWFLQLMCRKRTNNKFPIKITLLTLLTACLVQQRK